jgi:hypothetical protein
LGRTRWWTITNKFWTYLDKTKRRKLIKELWKKGN